MATVSIAVALAGCSRAQQLPPSRFVDPAPPQATARPSDGERPAAVVWDGLVQVGEAWKRLPEGAGDWPMFLGPERDNVCREEVDLSFGDEGPRLLWTAERGEGYVAPAIRDGRLVFSHRTGSKVFVDCLEAATGKRFWRFEYPSDYSGEFLGNQGPRATAAIDGQGRVFVHGVEGMLHCLDVATGDVLWKRDLFEEFELVENFFGVVSSPLLLGDDLIVNLGAPEGPCVAAFARGTGRLTWGVGDAWGASCASPVVGRTSGGDLRLFVIGGGKSRPPTGGLLVVDPARRAVLSRFPFRSRTYYSVTATSPLLGPDLDWVFLSSAYSVGSAMLGRGGEEGGWAAPKELWREQRIQLEFSNAVRMPDGLVYAFEHRGRRSTALLRVDPGTGDIASSLELDWTDEVVLRPGEEARKVPFTVGRGSLLAVGNELLCQGEEGHLLVIDTKGPQMRVVRRVWPFRAAETWTPPVVSQGLLYLCQNNRESYGKSERARLLCYDVRPQR